jgi:hypothetical protein
LLKFAWPLKLQKDFERLRRSSGGRIQSKGVRCTANEFQFMHPRKDTGRAKFRFPHSCITERFIYSHDRSTYFPATELADRSWEYCSPKHESRNEERGRAVSFLGIFVSNFRYSVFVVWRKQKIVALLLQIMVIFV